MPWSAARPPHEPMREVKTDIRLDPAWRSWVREVLEQVRFWPDHKTITKELMAHLEDGKADLLRLGYGQDLAEERVLKGMGDPVEIGRALDRAHQPWLGWLWQVSRWLAVLAAAWALTAILSNGGLPGVREWVQPYSQWDEFYRYEDTVDFPPPFQAGAYTITVEHAHFDGDTLYVEMMAQTPKFWLGAPVLYGYLEAVDSNGLRYADGGAPQRLYGSSCTQGHVRNTLSIKVDNIAGAPEWIEIRHRTAGWSFRLELPEREEEVP